MFIQVLPDLNCTYVQRVSHERVVGSKRGQQAKLIVVIKMFAVITETCGVERYLSLVFPC